MGIPRIRKSQRTQALLESLEPRQLLSSIGLLTGPAPHFVLDDASMTLIGTLANKNLTIPADAVPQGPAIEASLTWGDGAGDTPVLVRDAKGKIQIWAGHAFSDIKPHTISLVISNGLSASQFKRSAAIQLNAQRGRTLTVAAGRLFSGTLATIERAGSLPILTAPQSSLDLPDGSNFGQYAVSGAPAVATLRIDWGDGAISDGSFLNNPKGDYTAQGSHAYSTPGSYRVTTFIIIRAADRTLLHVDTISSTAHVTAPGARSARFSLPQQASVSIFDILPAGTLFPPSDPGGTTTPGTTGSGASSSGLDITGGATGAILTVGNLGGGILNLNGGSITTSRVTLGNLASSRIDVGSGVIASFDADGDFISAALSSASGNVDLALALNQATRINPDGSLLLKTLLSPGTVSIPSGATAIATLDSAGRVTNITLTNPASSGALFPIITVTGTTNVYALTPLDPTAALDYLASLHAGNLIFNLTTPSDKILSLLQTLPADFTGAILLPPSSGITLPSLPNATFLQGALLPPTTPVINFGGGILITNNPPFTGIGSITLSGTNTYTGTTTVTSGTLTLASGMIRDGGSGSLALRLDGSTLLLTGANTQTGSTTVQTGALIETPPPINSTVTIDATVTPQDAEPAIQPPADAQPISLPSAPPTLGIPTQAISILLNPTPA